jgi:flagellar motility protein MotE (MotC chaperone)
MADDAQQPNQKPETENQAAPKAGKSSILKYVLFGSAAFLFVVVVAVVTLLVFKPHHTDPPIEENTASAADEPPADDVAISTDSTDTLDMSDLQDPTVLENIMANLDFLDYEPTSDEMVGDDKPRAEVEDSIKQVNWLEKEKKRLSEKEAELEKREKKLSSLDKEVSKKLSRLEQAETARYNNLAKLYDDMDPRAVAKLVANLDDATVVSILPRMKRKNASQVLALMPATRAALLSKKMITIAEN